MKQYKTILYLSALLMLFLSNIAVAATESGPESLIKPEIFNHIGLNEVKQNWPFLNGQGVSIAALCRSQTYTSGQPHGDFSPNIEHNSLSDSDIYFINEPDWQYFSDHTTTINGLLSGFDNNAFHPDFGYFKYHGAAPEATIDLYEAWGFLTQYIYNNALPDCHILTLSFGWPFEDWWTRGLESFAEQKGIPIVAAIGNGREAFDPVLYPAASANIIGVGVIDSVTHKSGNRMFLLPYPEHSSEGPTRDARSKPDLVAPGSGLVPDANSPDTYHLSGDYSSFAVPVVTGTIATLIQHAQTDPNDGGDILSPVGNCLIKAILLNSADKLPYWHKGIADTHDDHQTAFDYTQGAGLINASQAHAQMLAGKQNPGMVENIGWDVNTLLYGDEIGYSFIVDPNLADFVTATLSWNRHYESTYPFNPLKDQNTNLRLELWGLDSTDPDKDTLLDYCDTEFDNVEHVFTKLHSSFTEYEIVVKFSSNNPVLISETISEPFAIAWSTGRGIDKNHFAWYDLDKNGIVKISDVTASLKNYGKQSDGIKLISGDINMDGKVDIVDINLAMEHINITPK